MGESVVISSVLAACSYLVVLSVAGFLADRRGKK